MENEQSELNEVAGIQAVIYCRSASLEPSSSDEALAPQEQRCRAYADQQGLELVKVFHERHAGDTSDRPVLRDMLGFIREHGDQRVTVLVDDVSRLARGLVPYHEVRAAIENAGAIIETPDMRLNGGAPSALFENLLVSAAAHRAAKEKA